MIDGPEANVDRTKWNELRRMMSGANSAWTRSLWTAQVGNTLRAWEVDDNKQQPTRTGNYVDLRIEAVLKEPDFFSDSYVFAVNFRVVHSGFDTQPYKGIQLGTNYTEG